MSANLLGSGGIGKVLGLGTGTGGQIANAAGGYLFDPANFSGLFGQNYGPGAFLAPNGTGGGLYPGKSLGSIGINASPLNSAVASMFGGELLGGAGGATGGGGLSSLFNSGSSDGSGQGVTQGLSLVGNMLSSLTGGDSASQYAPPFSSSGGVGAPSSLAGISAAGSLAGQPYYSASDYANYGPNAPNSASFAPPVGSPPAALSPAGGGAMSAPALGNLSPSGGGPSVPAPPLGGTTGGAPGQYYFNGQSWVQNPAAASSQAPTSTQLAAQDSAQVGNSYLQYLQALNLQKYRPTYAPAHNSAVGAPMYNPLAPAGPGGITPPQLVV